FCRDKCSTQVARATEKGDGTVARNVWTQLAELGWLGLLREGEEKAVALPGLCIIAEELGRAAYPLPFAETAAIVVPLLSRYSTETQREKFLEPIIEGRLRAALAIPTGGLPEGARREVYSKDADAPEPRGEMMANFLTESDVLVVPTRFNGEVRLDMYLRPPGGWRNEAMPDMANSSWSRIADSDLGTDRRITIGKGNVPAQSVTDAYRNYRLVTAAGVIGLAAQALDLSINYAKERMAFGRPIGSFQAVQQRVADAAMSLAAARLLCLEASIDVNPGNVAIACLQAAAAGKTATFTAQQIWGGMGYTLEVDVQLYFRRARAAQLQLGHSWNLLDEVWEAVVPH
ncbi:MAG: acyl-CoA dehydrogenase family protein, partial [Burkholderiales bacterium]